jgi:hypothetical protein
LAVLGASAGCSKGQQQKLTETRQGDSSDDRGAKGLTAAKPAPESAMEITTMYEYLLAACCLLLAACTMEQERRWRSSWSCMLLGGGGQVPCTMALQLGIFQISPPTTWCKGHSLP